jgi:uncharacterized flavoprotein (TIGR03862 family)
MKVSIVIVGSGPAAMMLASTLNENIFDVTIYEYNVALGRKFLVAGDGGLNLTYWEEPETFINRYSPKHLLENSIRDFNNVDLRNWLLDLGIETYVGSSNRVFPIKGIKPIEALNAILDKLKTQNVKILTKHEWKGWNDKDELIFENSDNTILVKPDIVVYALGGASWSKTGSTGKWTEFFKNKGVDIVPFQASNCAFKINWDKKFIQESEGKPLKNIVISCNQKSKAGEVVITQFGIEGGAVYALSPEIRSELSKNNTATINIDLKPTLSVNEILSKFRNNESRTISNVLKEQINLSSLQIALIKTIISKEDFMNTEVLSEKIKKLPMQIAGLANIEESISTVGGIALSETDDNFMLNKLPNNYVIGEMLDWDAPTGGYLLQGCFSMGNYLGKKLNEKYTLKS